MSILSTIHNKDRVERFVLFDLIRFISIFVIVPFHLSEFTFNSEVHPVYLSSLLNTLIIKFAKFIPFSGHTVLFLSFFLMGYGLPTAKKILKLIGWSLLGYGVVLLSYYEAPYPFLYWDVFSFLIVSLAMGFLFLSVPSGLLVSLMLGLATSSPTIIGWEFQALGGICSAKFQSSWPLFPWGFYAAFFACLGQELRTQEKPGLIRLQNQVKEHASWLLLLFLGSAVFVLKGITEVPATAGMYCFIQKFDFQQKAFLLAMWSGLFLYGSDRLANSRWSQTWLKYLASVSWNRNFALAYLVQIGLIGVVSSYPETFMGSPEWYDVALVGVYLGTEVVAQGILNLISFLRRRSSLH